MDFLINFYKELDTLNLIIFWGVIIVVILLLIFSITIANKNKKLKMIINSKEKNKEESIFSEEIDIVSEKKLKEDDTIIKKEDPSFKETIENESPKEPIKEEKFVAEEHVMEYNQEKPKPQNEILNSNKTQPKELTIPKGPYQRNVLREMSLNQTSPIGIVGKANQSDKIEKKAKELEKALNEPNDLKEEPLRKEIEISEPKEELKKGESKKEVKNTFELKETKEIKPKITSESKRIEQKKEDPTENNSPLKKETYDYFKMTKEPVPEYKVESYLEQIEIEEPQVQEKQTVKDNYLEEVSKKLAESEKTDDIDRTEYELQQEEEAIISYEELMKKKDTIKIIDEEEAIISIEELLRKKEQEDKLYNLTETEENDKFINELKSFRNDL